MSKQRHLDWDGCFNVRDLGGMRTSGGHETRYGAFVRADTLDYLTATGWMALHEYGIRTIIDLRNDAEIPSDQAPRPVGITTVHVPLDDVADTAFWDYCHANDLDGSPLYYRSFLDRKPERCAAALRAIARAVPGGVVFHCGLGRDRTGLISLLLQAISGVLPDESVIDYELSNSRLGALWAARGREDERPIIAAILARKQTSARALLLEFLASLDVAGRLCAAGLSTADVVALRTRLCGPDSSAGNMPAAPAGQAG